MRFAVLFVMISAGSGPLSAQVNRPPPPPKVAALPPERAAKGEAACSEYREAYRRGTESEARILEVYKSCPDIGSTELIARWRRRVDDPATLDALSISSMSLHDANLTEAALSALRDRQNPLPMRVAALRVVVAHARPDVWIQFGDVRRERVQKGNRPAADGDESTFPSFMRNPPWVHLGKNPVTDATKEQVRLAIRELVRAPGDAYLAVALRDALILIDPTWKP